ncbi:nucleoside 2-deoxyribosyltransferase [Nocardioides astragali]|uniref:Nucleoside 2-deoxyribosyltransferase n=1 Tax=Nocardioides astragali TaxID=1776736 RepID=A0ABW2MYE9_9ACTN|nr:nucleoside 2-deoxyribosyltransferase [Nocardioides astragali]
MQIYFAGPLFTPYERDFIAQAAARIRGEGIEVFVPHEQPLPEEVTPKAVFDKDAKGLFPANALVALLDGPMIDDGTACEIGLFHGMKMQGDDTKKGIIGLVTDTRSIGSEGRPLEGKGLNLYVRGCIEEIGEVVSDLDDVVAILKRWQAELA